MRTRATHDEDGSTSGGFLTGVLLSVLAVVLALYLGALTLGTEPATDAAPETDTPSSDSPAPSPPPSAGPPGSDRADFAVVYANVSSGVVRIATTGCADEGGGTGSGFLVEDDLVVTAAHVVGGYSSTQLTLGDQTASGTVVGYWPEQDLAIVRASRPLTGHVFEVTADLPPIGAEVVALGYPLSGPLSLAGPGIVSAYGEDVNYAWWDGSDQAVDDLMRNTLPTNPGNSGGPLVDASGTVVGLVSGGDFSFGEVDAEGNVRVSVVDGFKYAVTGTSIAERLDEEASLEPRTCAPPAEPAPLDLVTAATEGPETDAALAVFFDYFDGITRGDYERAYRQLTPARQENLSIEQFRLEQSSSYVYSVVVLEAIKEGDTLLTLVTFQSYQDAEFGPNGLECALWVLNYTLVPGGEHGWQIASSEPQPDRPRAEPCT